MKTSSKRSRLVRLALIGAPLLLAAACSDNEREEKALIYPDVQSCKADGKMTDEACQREFDNAQAEHLKKAPQYTSQTDCEADFGASHCEVRQNNGSSVFLPMMAGFMAANVINNLRNPPMGQAAQFAGHDCDRTRPGNQSNCGNTSSGFSSHIGSGGGWRGQPLYKSSDDNQSWRTADNRYVSRFSGEATVSGATTESSAGGRSLSRGGFGRTAASMHASSSSSAHSSGS